jgi:hypothetical protein
MNDEWVPPFCAHEVENVPCPKCGEEFVRVREKAFYYDGDTVEAFCAECHAEFEVTASVDVSFSDPEMSK